VGEVSLEAFVRDLEAVVDAAGLERFPLLGISQGCAVSIAYAVRHPQRVSHLVLFGGFAEGWKRHSPAVRERMEAMTALTRLGWDSKNPTFRHMFASLLLPDATKEQLEVYNEHQRRTTTGECAARYLNALGEFDVSALLEQVRAPTLVMHVRDDLIVSSKLGRELAQGIPGAQFISLAGRNHVLLETDAASDRFFDEIRAFLGR
jgi:pimeloyl-ACP methyl ester carboxylesterase